MTQKKSYSRFFIILQESEKGYALASDKLPTGYAKLEMKNDKCKVSFYVQNLKKEMQPYYMVLICNKKEVKKLINIGNMNIDDNGRMESSFEYPIDNLAGSSMTMDKVVGAAIVRFADEKIVDVMSGFASKEVSEWKEYDVFEEHRNVVEKATVEEKVTSKEKVNIEEQRNVQGSASVVKAQVWKMGEDSKDQGVDNSNIFDKYEQSIENAKNVSTVISGIKDERIDNDVTTQTCEINTDAAIQDRVETEITQKAELNIQDKADVNVEAKAEVNVPERSEINVDAKAEVDKEQINIDSDERKHEKHKNNYTKIQSNIDDFEHKVDLEDLPKGNSGMFFKSLVKGCEETFNICGEIKKCRWFNVQVKSLECLYDTSDYNKYTALYYPMITYYQYIRKHGHFLTGLKYDTNGNMKYLVYGILGSKSRLDQPFGGSTGFVTWAPLTGGMDNKGLGYWLMFYDYKDSSIAIPMK